MKTPRQLILADIAKVAAAHGVPVNRVMGDSRKRPVVLARYEAYYLLRKTRGLSYPRIAAIFDRDHTSVIHGIGRHLTVNRIDDPKLGHLTGFIARQNERRRGYWRAKVAARAAA